MRFLFVSPEICLHLLSDSTSRWTPLMFGCVLPTTGRTRDFHPLETCAVRHTYGRLHENVHWTFAAVRMLALTHIPVRSLPDFEKSDKNHILAHKAFRCACEKPPVALRSDMTGDMENEPETVDVQFFSGNLQNNCTTEKPKQAVYSFFQEISKITVQLKNRNRRCTVFFRKPPK